MIKTCAPLLTQVTPEMTDFYLSVTFGKKPTSSTSCVFPRHPPQKHVSDSLIISHLKWFLHANGLSRWCVKKCFGLQLLSKDVDVTFSSSSSAGNPAGQRGRSASRRPNHFAESQRLLHSSHQPDHHPREVTHSPSKSTTRCVAGCQSVLAALRESVDEGRGHGPSIESRRLEPQISFSLSQRLFC